MRLISCHIENFGKLSQLDLDFSHEIHSVYEKNGWGKSTLAAFLKIMFYGFENEEYVATGLGFGAESHHTTIKAMLDEYEKLGDDSENMQTIGCPILNTKALIPFGLKLTGETQMVAGAHILSKDYLNP